MVFCILFFINVLLKYKLKVHMSHHIDSLRKTLFIIVDPEKVINKIWYSFLIFNSS